MCVVYLCVCLCLCLCLCLSICLCASLKRFTHTCTRLTLSLFHSRPSLLHPRACLVNSVDGWLAAMHKDARRVLQLWRPHADTRIKRTITNSSYTGKTPQGNIFRQAPRATINPLFQSTLVLPTADKRPLVKAPPLVEEEPEVSVCVCLCVYLCVSVCGRTPHTHTHTHSLSLSLISLISLISLNLSSRFFSFFFHHPCSN